jgi:hypothetical protein
MMQHQGNEDTREVLWASFLGLFLAALTVTWWWYAMR